MCDYFWCSWNIDCGRVFQEAAAPGSTTRVWFEAHADGMVSLVIQGTLLASTASTPIFGSSASSPLPAVDDTNAMQDTQHSAQMARGGMELVGGVLYDIRVEYQRSSQPRTRGYLNVTWGWKGVAQHPIPSTSLLPSRRPVAGGWSTSCMWQYHIRATCILFRDAIENKDR